MAGQSAAAFPPFFLATNFAASAAISLTARPLIALESRRTLFTLPLKQTA